VMWVAVSLAVFVIAFGGVRLFTGANRISVTSVSRLLFAAGAAMVVRHAFLRSPNAFALARQTAQRMRIGAASAAVRISLRIGLASRLGVLIVGVLSVAIVGPPEHAAALRTFENPLTDIADRWDARWYAQIAVDGYRWRPNRPDLQQNVAFFPGYPLLIHVGAALIGARPDQALRRPHAEARVRERTLLAGLFISLAAFVAALAAFYRWAERLAGRMAAARAVALLSTFPFALFYSAPYTEAIFLLGSVSAFNAAGAGRSAQAGAWGLLVGLTRPNGFLLALPLAIVVAHQRGGNWRHWVAAVMPAVGLLAYCGYLWWLTGLPLAWAEAHAAWGRVPLTWDAAVSEPLRLVTEQGVVTFLLAAPIRLLNGAALVLAVALLPTVWRRLGAAATVFVVVNLIPPVMAGGLMSIGRLTSTMFPLFLALALVVKRRNLTPWLIGFALLQGMAAAAYFTWRPIV